MRDEQVVRRNRGGRPAVAKSPATEGCPLSFESFSFAVTADAPGEAGISHNRVKAVTLILFLDE